MKLCVGACLLHTLIVTYTAAYEDEAYERVVRTLNLFSKLRQAAEKRRTLAMKDTEARGLDKLKDKFDCKRKGEDCKLVPSCCGTMQCYWENGYSVSVDGECVDCVQANQTCQRDTNCCEGMHCEKAATIHINGVCQSPGPGLSDCVGEGQKCRTDGMCCGTEMQCDKDDWHDLDGKCGIYRRSGRCYTDDQCVTECVRAKWFHVYGECT